MTHKKLNPELESILLNKITEIKKDEELGRRVRWAMEIEKYWQPDLFSKFEGQIKENETYSLEGFYHCYIIDASEDSIMIGFYNY